MCERAAKGLVLPDAMLVDWQLGGIDGLQALAQLHERITLEQLPAALMVSSTERERLKTLDTAHLVTDILTKPVNGSVLFNAVNHGVVSRHGSTDRVMPMAPVQGHSTLWLPEVRVLLVDDSEINLEIAQHLLHREGARVVTGATGRQALQRLEEAEKPFDVVLMDVQMPVMDGLEATNRIRNELRLVDLPVIALTAGALADERRRALQAGFTNFLAKPIDPEEMIDAVRRAASARAATTAPAPLTVLPVPQPPSQPPVAVPAGWPAIDGIDTKAARRQLGGDHVLFQRLLTRLLAEHGDWAALSANAAAGWDGTVRAAWRARAHRLRGSAGVLGAQALARAATALEAALEPDAETAPAGPALAAVRTAFDALRAAAPADGVERRSPVQAAPITDADAAASAARIERLAEQLQAQDLEGVDTFEACRAALEVRLGAERVQALAKAIDNLEFAAARQFLDDALAWHDDTKA